MTKSDLIERLILKYPQSKAEDIENTVNMILEEMATSLEKGDRIEIRGFGSFSLRRRKERNGRNPKTGEKLSVEPHYVAAFRAGQLLKEKLWNLKKEDEK